MSEFKDLTGYRFNRLTAICPTSKRKYKCVVWLCRCDCGNLTEVTSNALLMKNTKSCGCLNTEKRIERMVGSRFKLIHGDAIPGNRARLYVIWIGIKARCSKPSKHNYESYGGRGIIICDEWKNDYPAFKMWALARGYKNNLTIDRIDNDGNYEPSNCQWLTKAENNRKGKSCVV